MVGISIINRRITQKIMAATAVVVVWLESHEGELASSGTWS
jgi:hypothetical protein